MTIRFRFLSVSRTFILLFAFALGACSGKGLILRDEPTPTFQSLGNLKIPVSGSPRLAVLEIIDDRPTKNAIGEAATGLTNQRQAITTELPVNEFVHTRLSRALESRGFVLDEQAKLAWKIRIRKLWVSEDTSRFASEKTRCDLEFQFDLVDGKTRQPKYQGNIFSEVVGTNSSMDSTSSNGPALESCLQVAVNKFIQNQDVQKLVGFQLR